MEDDILTPPASPKARSLSEISLEPYPAKKGKDEEDKDKSNLNNEASPGTAQLPSYRDLEAASKEDGLKWAQAYTKLMNLSIKQAHQLVVARGWSLLQNPQKSPSTVEKGIILYDGYAGDGNCNSYYKLKVRGVFNVRPERLDYVIRDHNYETRSRWDREHLVACRQLETFSITDTDSSEAIDVVMSECKLNIPLVSNRACLGIQWHGFDPTTGVYKYVFRTTQHRLFRPDPHVVSVQGLAASFVRILDGEEECDFTMIVYCNIGDGFPLTVVDQWDMKEWLRKRVALYVHVAQNWDEYYFETDNPKTNRK